MQKPLLALLAIIALVVGAYLLLAGRADAPIAEEILKPLTLAVSTTTIAEKTSDYEIDARYPQFGAPAVDTKIRTLVEGDIAELKGDAEGRALDAPDMPPYQYDAFFDHVYRGPDVVSARLMTNVYTGGAHGLPTVIGINIDRVSGRELTLDDALEMIGLSLRQLATEAKRQLEANQGEPLQFPEGASPVQENYATFYISKDKVTFVFQPYQVAAYAAGAPEISIPRK